MQDLNPTSEAEAASKAEDVSDVDTSTPHVPTDFQFIQTNSNTKAQEEFRSYDDINTPPRVLEHYRDMRMHQTVEFYERMEQKYSFDNGKYRLVRCHRSFLCATDSMSTCC